MRNWDLELLYHFIKRPGMYTGETEERGYKGVDKFIMAYELGSMGECDFRNTISNLILEKYEISMPSSGLEEQLKIAAQNLKEDWIELFVLLGKEILISESDKNKRYKYRSLLRLKILKLIDKEDITEVLINFHQIERQIKEWEGVNLEEDEILQVQNIMDMIKTNNKDFQNSIDQKTKNEISKLRKIIENKTKKNK